MPLDPNKKIGKPITESELPPATFANGTFRRNTLNLPDIAPKTIDEKDKIISDLTAQNQRLQERVNAAINQLKDALFNVKVSKDKNLFEIRMELLLKELTK